MTEAELLLQKVIKSQSCLDSQSGFKISFSYMAFPYKLFVMYESTMCTPRLAASTITDRMEVQGMN